METVYKKKVELDGVEYITKIIDSQSSVLPLFACRIYKKILFFNVKVYEQSTSTISPNYKNMIRDTLISYMLHEKSLKSMVDETELWNGKVNTR